MNESNCTVQDNTAIQYALSQVRMMIHDMDIVVFFIPRELSLMSVELEIGYNSLRKCAF